MIGEPNAIHADVSTPDEAGDFRITKGRFEARAYPMKILLGMAFDVDWDHVNDVIQGVPKSGSIPKNSILRRKCLFRAMVQPASALSPTTTPA